MHIDLLAQIGGSIFAVWFGFAFLYGGIRRSILSLAMIGFGFALISVPFLLDLFFGRSNFYPYFVWSGILLGITQINKYFHLQAMQQVSLKDILLLQ